MFGILEHIRLKFLKELLRSARKDQQNVTTYYLFYYCKYGHIFCSCLFSCSPESSALVSQRLRESLWFISLQCNATYAVFKLQQYSLCKGWFWRYQNLYFLTFFLKLMSIAQMQDGVNDLNISNCFGSFSAQGIVYRVSRFFTLTHLWDGNSGGNCHMVSVTMAPLARMNIS